ncbi:hypothetical protein [Candidatus Amarolinea aalborgensis]|jgi:hypothetical protein|uniref:hypothetical protein n=1 Tax=Candidatus Amarolinea aalborgensis TaxID=2249329 RepID=UPI003BF98BE3
MTQARGVAPAQVQLQPSHSHTAGVAYVPPPAYETDKFVARVELLQDFRQILETIEQGEPQRHIIMLWGVSGLGKTWIIRHLAHELGHDIPRGKRKGSCAVVFDFANDQSQQCRTAEELLWAFAKRVQEIAEGMQDQLVDNERLEVTRINEAIATSRSPETLASETVRLLQRLSDSFVPICLFDSLDILEDTHFDWFAWFEEYLWVPIGRDPRMLLVFAARKEMKRFQQFEVRRRLKRWEVIPFKADEVAAQLQQERRVRDAILVGNILYPYSFGHPYATWRLGEGLASLTPSTQVIDEHAARQYEKDFADLLRTVIEWWLNHVNMEVRRRLLAVATLRHFHIRAIQLFLAETESNESLKLKPDSYFQDIIRSMLSTDLTYWSQSQHGYVIDQTVRKIINRWLFLTDAAEHTHRHEIAKQLYVSWIAENPLYAAHNIIEAIYHDAMRTRGQCGGNLREEIELTVAQYLDPQSTCLDLEGALTLAEELKRDDELQEVIGDIHQDLLKRVDSLISEISQHNTNGVAAA